MRKSLFLFLFINFLNSVILSNSVFSQENDSLNYYHKIITNPRHAEKLEEAFNFFEKRIKVELGAGDTLSAVQDLRRIAIGQYEIGFVTESEITAVKALKLLENKPNIIYGKAEYALLNHLGMVYKRLGFVEKSLSFYENALKNSLNLNDSISIINNISNILLDQGEYEIAIGKFQSVYEKRKTENDTTKIARSLDNLGFAQSKINEPKGIKNMLKALHLRRTINDLPGIYTSFHHLSKYYFQKGDLDSATVNANYAYKLAKELNRPSYIENALSLLLDAETNHKILEFKELSDSIELAKQRQENKYAIIKYNVEKEKQKTEKAELEKEKQKQLKIIYLLVALIAILAIGFIVNFKNQQTKKELIFASQITEAKISKKIHDELANDVSGVMNYVETQIDVKPDKKNELLTLLNSIYLRARDISTQTADIRLKDFAQTIKNLIAQYQNPTNTLVTNSIESIDWQHLAEHKKIAIYRSIQELLVNTKKHAQATQTTIVFKVKGQKREIIYTDNGIGFNHERGIFSGLHNVETRMKNIGGSFSFESNEGMGFKAILLF